MLWTPRLRQRPTAVGVKVTAIEQVAAAARFAPHCEVAAKGPLAVTEVMVTATPDVLVKVRV
jgi:hypothetical protein